MNPHEVSRLKNHPLLALIDLSSIGFISLLNLAPYQLMNLLDSYTLDAASALGFWSNDRGVRSSGLRGSSP